MSNLESLTSQTGSLPAIALDFLTPMPGKSIMKNIAFAIFFMFLPLTARSETKILFLGDSITAGYGIEKRHSYPSLIERKLAAAIKETTVINGGISGSTSASALSRLKWYQGAGPDVLFLALGANDGLRGLSTEQLYHNLSQAIQFALDSGMRVILAGMKMPPSYGREYTQKFENVYRRLAREYSIIFMPFLLEEVGGRAELNLPDGIHPNMEGHKRIAENVFPYILQIYDTADR